MPVFGDITKQQATLLARTSQSQATNKFFCETVCFPLFQASCGASLSLAKGSLAGEKIQFAINLFPLLEKQKKTRTTWCRLVYLPIWTVKHKYRRKLSELRPLRRLSRVCSARCSARGAGEPERPGPSLRPGGLTARPVWPAQRGARGGGEDRGGQAEQGHPTDAREAKRVPWRRPGRHSHV